jgi:hypothetical protein
MNFGNGKRGIEDYPIRLYRELLELIRVEYRGTYWHVLPQQMAQFWRQRASRNDEAAVAYPLETPDSSGVSACA